MDSTNDSRLPPGTAAEEIRCAECGNRLAEGEPRQETEDAVFCRPCFERLTGELHQAVAAGGQDINYSMAVVGGLLGAALGVLVWWGFTVITNINFGLVAVVIGFAVGKGVTMLAGDKRHLNLQIISVSLSVTAFFYAGYLVNRTHILRSLAEQGEELTLPWLPDPALFYHVISLGFSPFDLVFLGIVGYQAWKMPAPLRLAPAS